MSIPLTLSHHTNTLSCDFFPPIFLSRNKDYEIGLLSFTAYNSVPNIDDKNNLFHYDGGVIEIPVGNYEFETIASYLKEELAKEDIEFNLIGNTNTFKTEMLSSVDIDVTQPRSVGKILGFVPAIYASNAQHISPDIVNIFQVSHFDIQCSIARGSYVNGTPSHSLHIFSPTVPAGFLINELPQQVIYVPVDRDIIENITINICDQDGNLVNFRGETVTVRIHIREKFAF